MLLKPDIVVVIMILVYSTKAKPAANISGMTLVHTGNHNIHNMFWKVSENDNDTCLFIVEADIDENGKVEDHGLYVLNNFGVKKVRDSARDGVMATDGSNQLLIGAKDGVYRCNCNSCEQERYGTNNDSIIGIVMERETAKIYVLNEEKQLYAITEHGNKVTIDDRIRNAEQIMMDHNDNLYYYGPDNQLYLVNNKGTKKIEGLPFHPSRVKLVRPVLTKSESDKEAVMIVAIDDKLYGILPDASSVLSKLFPVTNFTLINIENPVTIFLAKEKEIYFFSPIIAIFQALLEKWAKN